MQPEQWSRTDWELPKIDTDVPNSARIYDWLLGGGHNFDADRQLAKKLVAAFPTLPAMAKHARSWLRRAVFSLVSVYGVDQFLDLGAGLPSMGYTHEIAHAVNPAARVVYVDNDSIAIAHSQYVTEDLPQVTVVEADFTRPADVLTHPGTLAALDFSRPIAVIFSCALHLIRDEADPWRITAAFREATVPGSYLAISHASLENLADKNAVDEMLKPGSHPFVARSHAAVCDLFEGYDLLAPGVVFAAQWRPDFGVEAGAERSGCHVGVGVRRIG